MSINTNKSNSPNSDTILNQAVVQILGGHQDAAFARLTQCGLFNDEQIAKIRELIKLNPSHLTTTPLDLKTCILKELNTPILLQNKAQQLCLTETTSKSILEDLYKTPEFLSFSQSVQKEKDSFKKPKAFSFFQPVRKNPSFELFGISC